MDFLKEKLLASIQDLTKHFPQEAKDWWSRTSVREVAIARVLSAAESWYHAYDEYLEHQQDEISRRKVSIMGLNLMKAVKAWMGINRGIFPEQAE